MEKKKILGLLQRGLFFIGIFANLLKRDSEAEDGPAQVNQKI